MKGGNQIRTLLWDTFGLSTPQQNEAMDLLKSGASYEAFKSLLKTYGLNSQTINQIKPSINDYIDSLASSTPAPTPQTIGPLAPGVTSIPTHPAFDGYDPTSPSSLFPAPTPTPLYPNFVDGFPTISGSPGLSDAGAGGVPLSPGYIDEIAPGYLDGINGVGNSDMSIEELIALITAGLPEMPEMPEIPDFAGMLETAMGEQQDAYADMLSDLEAEQAAAAEQARLDRITEMSNMTQGGQLADFKAMSDTDRRRGGTSQFKRRPYRAPQQSMINRSLAIGNRNQLPGIGGVNRIAAAVPGILSQRAGSLNRRLY